MILNLSEVAVALGLKRKNILWEPALASRKEAGAACLEHESDRPVAVDDEFFRFTPWSATVPSGAQIDSRLAAPGDIFFCIKGENADGHDFGLDVARAGVCAIVAERDPFAAIGRQGLDLPAGVPPVFLTPDVVEALQRLAAKQRDVTRAVVVGVTGTAGKTSLKEALAHVLSAKGRTERNPLNKNSGIGLPLSMLNAAVDVSFWVMEAGINLPGDMDELGGILRPNAALILNVGEGHTEGLGDKGVAHYKSKLFDYVAPGGLALYSADYPDLEKEVQSRLPELEQKNVKIARFSCDPRKDAYCRVEYKGFTSDGLGVFDVFVDGEAARRIVAPFRGEMGCENMAAIIATARSLGLELEEIARQLATVVPPKQRFACKSEGDFVVVDDSYNANPLSSHRMLEAVREMAMETALPLILVMGQMGELGPVAEEAHVRLGRHMGEIRPICIFWKGVWAEAVRKGLDAAGYDGPFHTVSGSGDFAPLLRTLSPGKALVLFKGSRSNRLEEFVRCFSEVCAEQQG